jgi:hypothetical protein
VTFVAIIVAGAILLGVATRLRGIASAIVAFLGLAWAGAGMVRELVDGRPSGPVAVAAGVVFGLALRQQLRARRRQGLARFARLHGLRFSTSDDAVHLAEAGYRLLRVGEGRRVDNVLDGDWHGLPVRAADVATFDITSNWLGYRLKRWHRGSIAEASVHGSIPSMSIRPREMAHGPFAAGDARLGSEEFHRRFGVDFDDRQVAAFLLAPPLIEWLMTLPDGWGVELTDGRVLVHGPLVRPEDTGMVIGMVEGLAGVVLAAGAAAGTLEADGNDRSKPG